MFCLNEASSNNKPAPQGLNPFFFFSNVSVLQPRDLTEYNGLHHFPKCNSFSVSDIPLIYNHRYSSWHQQDSFSATLDY